MPSYLWIIKNFDILRLYNSKIDTLKWSNLCFGMVQIQQNFLEVKDYDISVDSCQGMFLAYAQ